MHKHIQINAHPKELSGKDARYKLLYSILLLFNFKLLLTETHSEIMSYISCNLLTCIMWYKCKKFNDII